MNQPPIPTLTPLLFCGAIGDLMRAAFAWGAADTKGEGSEAFIPPTAQAAIQLFALVARREPTDEEMKSILGI